MCVCTCVFIYMCVRVCVHVYSCVCIHVCVCVCTCVLKGAGSSIDLGLLLLRWPPSTGPPQLHRPGAVCKPPPHTSSPTRRGCPAAPLHWLLCLVPLFSLNIVTLSLFPCLVCFTLLLFLICSHSLSLSLSPSFRGNLSISPYLSLSDALSLSVSPYLSLSLSLSLFPSLINHS